MTTEPFDPRTAGTIGAQLADTQAGDETDMPAVDKLISDCFTALGTTAQDIAATLLDLGCFGTRPEQYEQGGVTRGDLVDPDNSPVAVYFRTVCGADTASFGTTGGQVVWAGDVYEIGNEDVTLPEPVSLFQGEYEAGEHPQLFRAGSLGAPVVRMVPMTNLDPADFLP